MESLPVCLSFALIYTLICLSFSIHPPLHHTHTHLHTVFPSFLVADSPAECCIIPSVGEAGDGGRDGGMEGRERQQGE